VKPDGIDTGGRGRPVRFIEPPTPPQSHPSTQQSPVARQGRTLRQWRTEILAHFNTGGVSNGGTEAINGVVETTRRLAHDFRNFSNYRIRILLAADGSRPYQRGPRREPEPC
jgi:hypothetical protein